MCGPIATLFGLAQQQRGRGGPALLAPYALYHGGRLTSYALLGLLFGLAGSVPALLSAAGRGQAVLSLAIGTLMALLALAWLGALPFAFAPERIPALRGLGDRVRGLALRGGRRGEFGLGVANGLLPCGPVALVALAAATSATPWRGAVSLLTFGLGTVPALVLVGVGVGVLPARARLLFHRVGAVLLVLMALQLVARGLAAFGVLPHLELGRWMLW
jgi:sulfite exporter TauE/SafE